MFVIVDFSYDYFPFVIDVFIGVVDNSTRLLIALVRIRYLSCRCYSYIVVNMVDDSLVIMPFAMVS